MTRKVEFNDAIRETMEERQREHEERLAWLRGLKTGDVVAVTWDGPDGRTVARAAVTRVQLTGFAADDRAIFVDGHHRRPLRSGKWERGGQNWLQLRIDPVAP